MAAVRYPKFVDPTEISEIMFTEDQIRQRVKELGAEISAAYKDIEKPLVLIGTLKGATPFFADLARELDVDAVWEFMSFSSYGMGTTSGAVQCVLDLKMDICGRDVLIVEVTLPETCLVFSLVKKADSCLCCMRLRIFWILATLSSTCSRIFFLATRIP